MRTSQSANNKISISVSQNGADVSECITGVTPCVSLDYVLRALGNQSSPCLSSDVIVNIEYAVLYIEVPIAYTFVCDLNLRIRGSQINVSLVPNVICSTEGSLTFSSSSNSNFSIFVQWESINIINCSGPHAIGLTGFSFSACQVMFSRGMCIKDTSYVDITESQFVFSEAYSKDACLVVTNEAMTRLSIKDSVFVSARPPKKTATTLWIVRCVLQIEGNVTFMDSFGQLGGAVRMTYSQVIATGNATVRVLFVGNRAQYGSAVYVENIACPLLSTSIGYPNVNFVFQNNNNTGNTGETVIYIDGDLDNCVTDNLSYNVSSDNVNYFLRTTATNISTDLPVNFDVFPGRDIILNVSVTDYFQNAVICSANMTMILMYNGEQLNISCNDPRYEVELACPLVSLSQSSLLLSDSSNANSTLQIRTATDPAILQLNLNITIAFVCNSSPGPEASISFTVQKCPPFLTLYNIISHVLVNALYQYLEVPI